MKKRFIELCYQFILKHQECDDLKTKKIKYGLESLYNLVTKLVVLLILTIILGIWKEYFLFTLVYALTKRYTYGIHAKSSLACWLVTLTVYLIGCYFIKYASIPQNIVYLLWFLGFGSFLLWAPADTPARPLIHKEIREKQKLYACATCILYLSFILIFQNQVVNNVIIYSLLVQIICINPLTYFVTKTPFGNYKLYYKNHGLNY